MALPRGIEPLFQP